MKFFSVIPGVIKREKWINQYYIEDITDLNSLGILIVLIIIILNVLEEIHIFLLSIVNNS